MSPPTSGVLTEPPGAGTTPAPLSWGPGQGRGGAALPPPHCPEQLLPPTEGNGGGGSGPREGVARTTPKRAPPAWWLGAPGEDGLGVGEATGDSPQTRYPRREGGCCGDIPNERSPRGVDYRVPPARCGGAGAALQPPAVSGGWFRAGACISPVPQCSPVPSQPSPGLPGPAVSYLPRDELPPPPPLSSAARERPPGAPAAAPGCGGARAPGGTGWGTASSRHRDLPATSEPSSHPPPGPCPTLLQRVQPWSPTQLGSGAGGSSAVLAGAGVALGALGGIGAPGALGAFGGLGVLGAPGAVGAHQHCCVALQTERLGSHAAADPGGCPTLQCGPSHVIKGIVTDVTCPFCGASPCPQLL